MLEINNLIHMTNLQYRIIIGVLLVVIYPLKSTAMEHLCNRWNVLMENVFTLGPVDGEYWTSGYMLQGDTIIENTHYARLLFANGFQKDTSANWIWEYYGALRETDEAEVYLVPNHQTQEYLLYAFNAQVGDTFENLYALSDESRVWAVVKEASETQLTLDLFERYQGSDILMPHNFVWIKGVGSLSALFQPIANAGYAGYVINQLLCAYSDNELIYTSPNSETYGCEYWRKPMEDTEDVETDYSMQHGAHKFIRDGHLFIKREGKIINAQGAMVEYEY